MASKAKKTPHKTNQKQLPRNAANRCFFVFFQRRRKETQQAPKRAPREAQMPPRSAPGGARSGPRGAKTAPGTARSAPGAPQEPPKRRQKGVKKGYHFRFRSRGGSGRPPGAILKRFGSDLGASGEAFWSHFWSHFRAYSCRILAAVVFLLFAALGSVCLRARAGKPGEKPQERTRNESPR